MDYSFEVGNCDVWVVDGDAFQPVSAADSNHHHLARSLLIVCIERIDKVLIFSKEKNKVLCFAVYKPFICDACWMGKTATRNPFFL